MNGCPKMKLLRSRTTNSRSMDSADLLSFSPSPKNPISKTPCFLTKPITAHDLVSDLDDEVGRKGGKNFGGVLRRNSSVTSASSSSIHSSLKRAFSMRRSSSVSERYCRIHDQSATAFLQSPPHNFDVDDEEEAMDGGGGAMQGTPMVKKMMKKKQKNGKIFKACKRLFGL